MTDRDLTPEEARAEIEAFLGDKWRVHDGALDNGSLFVGASCGWVMVRGYGATLRECVSTLKSAWRDAVRPWVESAFDEGCDYIGNEKNVEQHVRIARVLKEDSK